LIYPACIFLLSFGAATGAFAPDLASALVCNMSPGNVNPSTVFLSCVASSESFEIEAAVAVAALPV
jgi:hypothetical protein